MLRDIWDIFESETLGCLVLIFIALNILLILNIPAIVRIATQETLVITVTEKERLKDRYLVWTEDEVFENTDDWVFFKWNSSDVYGEIEVGKRYKVKVSGLRVRMFSWYRNIIKINGEAEWQKK